MELKLILLQLLAAESLFGSAVVYFKKENRTFSIGILAVFLLCLGLIFLETFVINFFGYDNSHPLIVLYSYLFFVLCLILPPTFYLYVLSLVKTKAEILEKYDIKKHYAPAAALLLVNVFAYFALYSLSPASQNHQMLYATVSYLNFISLSIVFLLQNGLYLFLSWQLYNKEKVILTTTQSKETNLTLKWMLWFVILYTVLIAMLYIFQLRPLMEGKVVFRIFTIIYVSLIIFFGRNNYQFIIDNIKTDTLDDAKRKEIKAALLLFMETKQPYLQPDLTIKSLAHDINTNSKYLSYLINQEFNCNFSTYVNSYRVKEAKKLLSDAENDIYTIESIAKMTGFKSKSTFNAVFKKETMLTPTQFKQQFKKS